MKRIFSIMLAGFLVITARGQSEYVIIDDNNMAILSSVTQVPELSKNEIYIIARQWFANTFKSAKHVLQMDDREGGVIIGKAYSPMHVVQMGFRQSGFQMHYTLELSIREGRYKLDMIDISYKKVTSSGSSKPHYTDRWTTDEELLRSDGRPKELNMAYKENTLTIYNNFVEDLKMRMAKSTGKEDDW
jgi:hypothetical protein